MCWLHVTIKILLTDAIHTHTHTIIPLLFWNLSGTTRVSRCQKGKTRKGKTNLDLLEQEIVSGSGICWAICKSVPHPRQPCQHPTTQLFTGWMPFLPPNQQYQKHWRVMILFHIIKWKVSIYIYFYYQISMSAVLWPLYRNHKILHTTFLSNSMLNICHNYHHNRLHVFLIFCFTLADQISTVPLYCHCTTNVQWAFQDYAAHEYSETVTTSKTAFT